VPARDRLPDAPPPAARKDRWRAWARASRRLLASAERDRRVVDALAAWPPYQNAGTVLLYLAFGSEVDLGPLVEDGAKRVVIPRSVEAPTPELTLHLLRGAALERHPFGPRQPRADTPTVDPATVELALLPGLCFDVEGTRLGYGRGYFDRFLERLPAAVPRVGVTYDALVVAGLPREAHDRPVTHLATESGVRAVAGRPPAPPAPPSW
jgi:5-formyltetrahydrofolate cyclo-ligase